MRPYSSLDPLPRLVRQEKDCHGFARGCPVTNESNKPSLEVLGSLQDGHELHWTTVQNALPILTKRYVLNSCKAPATS
jgi:hypothetical protein